MFQNKIDPFAEGVPSVFVLQSPFQGMCAINAIHHFKIKDYRVIIYLYGEKRDQQLIDLLENNSIKYEIILHANRDNLIKRYWVFHNNDARYKRAFVGDMINVSLNSIAYKFLTDWSSIIYLDDGSQSISILSDNNIKRLSIKNTIITYYFDFISRLRHLCNKNYYTIYNIETKAYNCVLNEMEFFKAKKTNVQSSGVYFLGTNPRSYCSSGTITEKQLEQYIEMTLRSLRKKHKGENITFIPHGLDVSLYPQELCKKYDILYQKNIMPVEMFFNEKNDIPKYVYGFSSTALYNLKKLFPECEVYNIVPEMHIVNSFTEDLRWVADFYEKNGINTIKWIV